MARGKFITFEGGEGSGKSTQAGRLVERLRGMGLEVVQTREPGGTPLGERIRDLLLSETPSAETEFLLFAAARAEHVASVVRPALVRGAWVVSDRFIDSTRVYQGALGGVSGDLIHLVEQRTVGAEMPDLTLVLDLSAEDARRRVDARGALSRFDAEHESNHTRRREAFRALARSEPGRIALIEGGRAPDEVARDVWHAVEARLLTEAR
jgi:dTMP kinase